MRPVINLKPINRYLRKHHFKMDTMQKVLNLVKSGDWAITLDLKDAYFHVPICPTHRKFLRFSVLGKNYQFKALCFGPTSAPRVFTKIVSVVAAHLRKHNIRLATYLDDWLLVNKSRIGLVKDRELTLNLLTKLGFIVNAQKSVLTPSQDITYIGGHFKLEKVLVFPTPERIAKLYQTIHSLLRGNVSARSYLTVLGVIASALELIPNGRLFMRPIQLHLLQNWHPSRMSLNHEIACTQELRSHFTWWLEQQNTLRGRSLTQFTNQVTVTTDASTMGWGGHSGNQKAQGTWSPLWKLEHINCLELEAVFRTVKHFLPSLKNKNVLIRSDNTTTVQYINKQGGTRSPKLCQLAWKLWQLAIQNNIVLRAAHIAGSKNVLADSLSRVKVRETEWSLNPKITHQVFNHLGQPVIDLFASYENKKTQVVCSWVPHPQALALDALSITWENMFAYAFPPTCLIPKVLQHMKQFHCELILIAPHWSRQHWYPQLLELLIACPLKLPAESNLLSQAKGKILHQNPQSLKLTAWLLSTDSSKQRDFLKTLEIYCLPRGGQVHKKITSANFDSSVAGVKNRKLIPMLQL